MKPDLQKQSERWFCQAEHDLDDGRFALSGDRYSLTCFMAQQCAEKAIKAFLLAKGT